MFKSSLGNLPNLMRYCLNKERARTRGLAQLSCTRDLYLERPKFFCLQPYYFLWNVYSTAYSVYSIWGCTDCHQLDRHILVSRSLQNFLLDVAKICDLNMKEAEDHSFACIMLYYKISSCQLFCGSVLPFFLALEKKTSINCKSAKRKRDSDMSELSTDPFSLSVQMRPRQLMPCCRLAENQAKPCSVSNPQRLGGCYFLITKLVVICISTQNQYQDLIAIFL